MIPHVITIALCMLLTGCASAPLRHWSCDGAEPITKTR
jgi:hypothetical protein